MPRRISYNPNMILPPGTQVVTRVEIVPIGGGASKPVGAVAEIVLSPTDHTHAYRLRFADGVEAMARRSVLAVLKRMQRDRIGTPDEAMDEYMLTECVIYRCVVGSRAYGLDVEASDVDRRGVFLPPAEMHWSLYGVPEQLENDATQECYWELQKFITLALKANPNVLECLFTPLVEDTSPIADALLAMRDAFLSKLIYQTYNGYVLSQFRKLTARERNHGVIKWKHAMHLIRLLLAGVETLRSGVVPVEVGPYRERLLEIRRGELPWEEINAWRLALHAEFDAAFERTSLPDRPDYERANRLLIDARRAQV
ncbi:MAG TPA: nucleotidyltransferase domain-containing protein [Phycisphaerae bacterium]|nr:nucleotidyltransferase domain-containing protein [Phycisphaerae bacterium]HRW51380.1 nucleotidyltransferase domain-containing protein [Phycisphaerae bacterium]